MVSLYLKDGSRHEFDADVCGLDVAQKLSSSLRKKVVAVRVDGVLWDMTRTLPNEVRVEFVTNDTVEGLEVIRHDAAHLFAQAVKELYPSTQITIGPAIANGFYYDVYNENNSFTPDDLKRIEEQMHRLVDLDIPITREEWSREEALHFFKNQGEHFKVEIIEGIDPTLPLTLYRQGGFVDLCRGPHLPSTKHVGHAFKLTKIAGAYWRADPKNPMLQRIYGTAWVTEKDLKDHLFQIEEAERRDHRKLGVELGLFHLQEEAQGSVFWHPKGYTLYRIIEDFMRENLEQEGYVEVKTPQVVDSKLWKASGHWEKFQEHMFSFEAEKKVLAIKPMNCPCHVQIFKQGLKSYRDLPLRMAEFGCCHRNEPSGALHGLMRVRSFTQDDAHIFCTQDQIVPETKAFCDFLKRIYKKLGFCDISIRFSDRPIVRAGSDNDWDQSEEALRVACVASGLSYTFNPGEGAFYGPKLEFVLKDALNREWQCGTLQVDVVLPERLDASYVGEDGKHHRPVMLHRAILGSFERFIGILIEHYAGNFPLWLAPTQAVVCNVSKDTEGYANQVFALMKEQSIRVLLDTRQEKISYKIREHSLQKVPYILVLGPKEVEAQTVTLRSFGSQSQRTVPLQDLFALFKEEPSLVL